MSTDNSNPFVGLRPFEAAESILFFGRAEQTLELLQRLHLHHFVAVVGSSGSGKSSLLRAGLIPSLKAGYLVNDSDNWLVSVMKPGQSPLYNFTESLLIQLNAETDSTSVATKVLQIKEGGADVIIDLLIPLKKEKNMNFFLLVDQFEEIFRFAMDQDDVNKKDESIDFVNIILELAHQEQLPFYVVITMRSDFIGDCVQFNGLPEAMNQSQYLVPRINRVQMKTVIEGPAKLFGYKINPALTSRLLNDLGRVKDELPLLQHALMRIWDYHLKANTGDELDLQDYEKIGGIEKALSNHADEAIDKLDQEGLQITRKMFQALTAIDENGRKIRRPVLLGQLKELTGAKEEQLLGIINILIGDGRSFLLVNTAGNSTDKIIDISHESLIRQWSVLEKWVDEEAESASNYFRLAEAAKLFKQKKKDYLSGSELQLALDWYAEFKPVAVWANRYKTGFEECIVYLKQSEAERSRLINVEKRRKQKQRYLLAGLIIVLCVALFSVEQGMDLNRQNQEVKSDNSRTEAQSKKIQAALVSAEIARNKAEQSDYVSRMQRERADSATLQANQQKRIAQLNMLETKLQKAYTDSSLRIIQIANDTLKMIIESKAWDEATREKLLRIQKKLKQPGAVYSLVFGRNLERVTATYELGVTFKSLVSGMITAIKLKLPETGTRLVTLWKVRDQSVVKSMLIKCTNINSWENTFELKTPIPIEANSEYILSVNSSSYYRFSAPAGTFPYESGNIILLNYKGHFGQTQTFPDMTYTGNLVYGFVDFEFKAGSIK